MSMNFRYLITVSLLFVLTAATLHGQSRRRRPVVPATLHIEDLPQQPLDTLATDDPETRIIIFSNNTWRYYRPALKVRDSLPVYMQHWDTSQVFAYKSIAYEDLPSVVDLNLVKDLSGFKASGSRLGAVEIRPARPPQPQRRGYSAEDRRTDLRRVRRQNSLCEVQYGRFSGIW